MKKLLVFPILLLFVTGCCIKPSHNRLDLEEWTKQAKKPIVVYSAKEPGCCSHRKMYTLIAADGVVYQVSWTHMILPDTIKTIFEEPNL